MKKNLKSVLCIVFLAVSLFGIVGCKDDENLTQVLKFNYTLVIRQVVRVMVFSQIFILLML